VDIARDQFKADVEHFRLDQRAWLGVRIAVPKGPGTTTPSGGDAVAPRDDILNGFVTNSGKTPSTRTVAIIGTWSHNGGPYIPSARDRDWFAKMITLRKADKFQNYGYIFISDFMADKMRRAPPDFWPPGVDRIRDQATVPVLDSVGVIPPGDTDYELPPLQAQSSIATIMVYGEITYEDVFNEDHWLRFCYYRGPGERGLTGPRYHACPVFNDLDQPSRKR